MSKSFYLINKILENIANDIIDFTENKIKKYIPHNNN